MKIAFLIKSERVSNRLEETREVISKERRVRVDMFIKALKNEWKKRNPILYPTIGRIEI